MAVVSRNVNVWETERSDLHRASWRAHVEGAEADHVTRLSQTVSRDVSEFRATSRDLNGTQCHVICVNGMRVSRRVDYAGEISPPGFGLRGLLTLRQRLSRVLLRQRSRCPWRKVRRVGLTI